jgi:MFS transporter, ACS family, hexuronate transporter
MQTKPAPPPATTTDVPGYRWRIVALLFFATTINYVDRSVLSYVVNNADFKRQMLDLAPGALLTADHEKAFNVLYGNVQSLFKLAYGLGFILMGWLIDRLGTRVGYAISIAIWSLSAVAHGFVGSVRGLMAVRVGLGIGEAGNFPSAIKTVAEWFPQKERSMATGLFNSGANLGIIATAFSVPYLLDTYGWQRTFLVSSCLGVILLILWLINYHTPDKHPRLTATERTYIEQDDATEVPGKKLSWGQVLPYRQTWAFALGKFMTDCVWWFYLTWLPKFFNENAAFKLDLKTIGPAFLVIYLVSDGGSILFGWVSSAFLRRGWSANRARKTTMLMCALCVVPIYFASVTSSVVVAVALIAVAAAAHQGWSANLYTIVTDMFPKRGVASVIGFGGMFGALGGALLDKNSGWLINSFGYGSLFLIASVAYLSALVVIHLLVPRLRPINS